MPQFGQCDPPPTLQQLDTQIIAADGCFGIDGTLELCTDSPDGVSGACYGDSSGPQIVKDAVQWRLVGVTSRSGIDSSVCGSGPAISTNVFAYTDWITRQTT